MNQPEIRLTERGKALFAEAGRIAEAEGIAFGAALRKAAVARRNEIITGRDRYKVTRP